MSTLAGARTALNGTEPERSTLEQWQRLRAPFPPEQIEKLPATDKRPELDYVSAAHVIDRILSVDPTWTWTWGVSDPQTCLPSKALSLTKEDNGSISLWMALTVCGVSRTDVGYVSPGKFGLPDEPMKHVVSDAITRCARLHGVALDLWIGTPRPVQSGAWRHEKDGREPIGAPCPSDGCTGHLVQRTAKKDGHPFLSCDSWSRDDPGCGIRPIDGTMEDYVKSIGLGEVALDPAEFGEPFPFGDRPPTLIETVLQEAKVTPLHAAMAQEASLTEPAVPFPGIDPRIAMNASGQAIPPLTGVPANCQEIRRLIEGMAPETIRDVFTSVSGGSQIISPRSGGGWKLGLGKLADAGEAVQIELIAALVSARE